MAVPRRPPRTFPRFAAEAAASRRSTHKFQVHRRRTCRSRKCAAVCCAAALLVSIAGGFLWIASRMHYRLGGTQQSHQPHKRSNSNSDSKSNSDNKRNRKPYLPDSATYIDGAFSKILKSRDRRDSLAHPRKSGRGSPRDTLGSSDGEGNVFIGAGTSIRLDAKKSESRRQVVVPGAFPPRVVSCTSAKSHARTRLKVPEKAPGRKRRAPWTRGQQQRQDYLKDEAYYDNDDHMAEDPYENHPECVPMHEWQVASYPSCNALHVMDLGGAAFVANGFFRDVWAVNETTDVGPEQLAVKTLRLRDSSKLDYDARNYHRHNVDAIVHERLTAAPHVMNLFGFCGMSIIVEFANGGDLGDALSEGNTLTKKERFKTALEITEAVSDLHNFNQKVPAIAHSDIWHSQFVKTKRGYVLADFNRAQFLFWNTTSNASSCPYYYQHSNGYPFRSPEEYSYQAQTEKIDVYSVGNILFSLLMDKWPYEDLYKEKNTEAVSKHIVRGDRDALPTELLESTDPIDVAIRTAMDMCWIHDWRERPSAKDIAQFLLGEKSRVGIV